MYQNYALTIDGFESASEGLQNTTITVLNISNIVESFAIYNVIRNTTFQFLKHTSLNVLLIDSCNVVEIEPKAIFSLPQTSEYLSLKGDILWRPYAFITTSVLKNLKVVQIPNQLAYKAARIPSNAIGSYPSKLSTPRKSTLLFENLNESINATESTLANFAGEPLNFNQGLSGRFFDSYLLLPIAQNLEVI